MQKMLCSSRSPISPCSERFQKKKNMPDREKRTILLVDSSASILFYVAMVLKRLEYKVMTARSAAEALRLMEETVPSIILTELSLPDQIGIEFIKAIKDSPRCAAVPVIVLTTMNDPKVQDTCKRMGCAGYLFKPVEPDVLYRSIQAASESIPRAHIRLATSLKVMVEDERTMGGLMRTEYATAISEGGLYLRTLKPYPRNSMVSLHLFINDRTIAAKAVVLYTYALGEGRFEEPGMGMKFVELADADRDVIRRFIKEQLTKDIAPA